MKVLCTGLFPYWQCHLLAECNFIEQHLSAGDQVAMLACERSLGACDANPRMSRMVCMACIGLRQSALSMLSQPPEIFPLVEAQARRRAESLRLPHFGTLEELENFFFENLPAGKDVISSLATSTGLPKPKVAVCPALVHKLLRDYLSVAFSARSLLARESFGRVYIFNGRFAVARAWMRVCEEAGVDYVTQERMGMPDRVLLIVNGSPHHNSQFARLIREFWEANKNDEAVRREAVDFYEERPAGKLTGWISYVRGQTPGNVEKLLAGASCCVAVFPSSEAEFAGVEEYFKGAAFADQQRAYLDIARELAHRAPDMRLILRIHPNSRHEAHAWWKEPQFQDAPNLVVVNPEDPVSSYELMWACEKTMVFMSSMGAEATYWGKPSIVLSNAMYRGAGVCHEPNSVQDVVAMLADPSLPALPRENALAFGAFMRLGARKLPLSESLDHCKLTFRGKQPAIHPRVLKYRHLIEALPHPLRPAVEMAEWHWLHLALGGQFGVPAREIKQT